MVGKTLNLQSDTLPYRPTPNNNSLPGTSNGWYTARPGPLPATPAGRRPHLSTHGGPGCPLLPRAPPTEQRRRLRAFSQRGQTALGTRRRRAFDAQDLGAAASLPRSCVHRRSSRHSPVAASRPLDPLTSTRRRRCAAVLRPLGHAPPRPDGRGTPRSDAALTRRAITSRG